MPEKFGEPLPSADLLEKCAQRVARRRREHHAVHGDVVVELLHARAVLHRIDEPRRRPRCRAVRDSRLKIA